LEEIEPINVMDFFNKKHWELPVQTIFIYSRWRWWNNSDEYVDVRKRYTLKGFMEQLHMSWDILVPTRFGFHE
jgi:hypothetical protein